MPLDVERRRLPVLLRRWEGGMVSFESDWFTMNPRAELLSAIH